MSRGWQFFALLISIVVCWVQNYGVITKIIMILGALPCSLVGIYIGLLIKNVFAPDVIIGNNAGEVQGKAFFWRFWIPAICAFCGAILGASIIILLYNYIFN